MPLIPNVKLNTISEILLFGLCYMANIFFVILDKRRPLGNRSYQGVLILLV